jgi:hypothetical protein
MKITAALAAVAILGCGAAFAADAPATSAKPAAPSATPIKHTSLKACNKQADGKGLMGADRTAFVKSCHAGKTAG